MAYTLLMLLAINNIIIYYTSSTRTALLLPLGSPINLLRLQCSGPPIAKFLTINAPSLITQRSSRSAKQDLAVTGLEYLCYFCTLRRPLCLRSVQCTWAAAPPQGYQLRSGTGFSFLL
jgi:hypothetical protein